MQIGEDDTERIGQLQDAGNTTTLAHYLKLLETDYLISGLELFTGDMQRKRGSSPKLITWNNGLINALTGDFLSGSRSNYSWWGRLIENAVGAHLLNHLGGTPYSVYYSRHKNMEVDFVVKTPRQLWGIEAKSGKPKNPKGVSGFLSMYPDARTLTVGSEGMPVETSSAPIRETCFEGKGIRGGTGSTDPIRYSDLPSGFSVQPCRSWVEAVRPPWDAHSINLAGPVSWETLAVVKKSTRRDFPLRVIIRSISPRCA